MDLSNELATDALYLRDSYLQSTAATVIAVDQDARSLVLDQTVLYSGGGGQPADSGLITRDSDGQSWQVVASKKAGRAVIHQLGGDKLLPNVGDLVTVTVDWDNRYKLMRTHTAMHVLCGVIWLDYGAQVTGGNMGVDGARMDFELEDLSPERVAHIERRANEEIAANHPITVRSLPRDEAFQIPDLIRTKINLLPEGITEVRIVEIEELDLQADGGTHVANTSEVGGLRVVGTRSKGKSNKRLEIELTDPEGSTVA